MTETNGMRFVILESPFAGDVERNVAYATHCMRDSLMHGEAPFMSHLLYTPVLNDLDPGERRLGIEAGLYIGSFAAATVVYHDYGISKGMLQGITRAEQVGRPVEYRQLFAKKGAWE